MKLSVKTGAASFLPSDTVAFFLPEKNGGTGTDDLPEAMRFLADRIDLSLFRGKSGETLFLPLRDRPNAIIIGLGKPDDLSPESLRNIAGNCITACKKKKIVEINLLIPRLQT
jgi:leucyl aminopeptidase